MFWKKDLFGPFSPQVCLGVYSLMEKQGRFFRPAPAVGLQPSVQVLNRPRRFQSPVSLLLPLWG